MRVKKIIATMLAVVLTLTSFQMTTFAENSDYTDTAKKGDAVAIMEIDNPECLEIKNLTDLKVVVESEATDPAFRIEIPIKAVEIEEEGDESYLSIWLGYSEDVIEAKVLAQIAELQGDIVSGVFDEDAEDAWDEMGAMLSELKVSIAGLPEGHYTLDSEMTGCMLITKEIVEAILNLVEDMLEELYPEIKFDEIEGFRGLVEAVLAQEDMTLDEIISMLAEEDPEAAKELEELFATIDEAIAYLTSPDFPGLLIAGAYLTCNCPKTESYEIVHQYYKKMGDKMKLVGSVSEGEPDEFDYYCLEGKSGDVIKAENFVNCEYKGVTYNYVGSYNIDVMYDDYQWEKYGLSEFVLGDEDTLIDGLLLRYVIEDSDTKDDETGTSSNRKAAPPTGDTANALPYLVLIAGAVIMIIANRKKNKA